jgi:murein DD-endopeptidase MepM/ murein hydrolase activator NlpD
MARAYVVKKGDTLAKIAEKNMGGRRQAAVLADYNALRVKKLAVGSRILIPAAADLKQRAFARPRAAAWPPPPAGLQGVLDAFGNIYDFIRDDGTIDPRWEAQNVVRVALPFAIPLDWDPAKSAAGIRCHKSLAPLFTEVFKRIVDGGLKSTVRTYGGCYQYRAKRNGTKPSTHSWGIAIDFNVGTNGMGTAGDMDPRLVELMEGLGFVWGGRWSGKGKDPMHFQYCSAY